MYLPIKSKPRLLTGLGLRNLEGKMKNSKNEYTKKYLFWALLTGIFGTLKAPSIESIDTSNAIEVKTPSGQFDIKISITEKNIVIPENAKNEYPK